MTHFVRLSRYAQSLLSPLIVCLALAAPAAATWRPFRCAAPVPAAVATSAPTDHVIYLIAAGLTIGAAILSAVQCVKNTFRPSSGAKPKG